MFGSRDGELEKANHDRILEMIRNLLLIVFRYPEVQDEAKAFSVAVTKEHSSRVGRHL